MFNCLRVLYLCCSVLLSDSLWTYRLLVAQCSIVSLSHAYARGNEHVDVT